MKKKKEELKKEGFKHLTNILNSSLGKNIIKPKFENNKQLQDKMIIIINNQKIKRMKIILY